MAYQIVKDDCTNCGSCESACPLEAITEKDGARWIDAEKCGDCGTCEPECPVNAINAG
ncbi:MAG: 4Fe-4S binding protein [Spirochaetaceae bacterium]|jgi:NAD-dependent dihydropyrimidine dehydrogenase PreA subunit|nr:4Fe-4S binding protein [Spirochaetaceae bacterium]